MTDSAVDLLQRMERGDTTATALVESSLRQIESYDDTIRAFLSVDSDGALSAAAKVDEDRKAGRPVGKLAGLPVAVKDLLCQTGVPTTCGSRILEQFVSPYDAHVITQLRNAGAILIGKTNMDEFGMGSTCEASAFQPTRNPWDTNRVPGGSSGGSAAAIAAAMVPLAVGTDTGGSIRQPASFCGVVGMKPTYGRVSRFGLVAYASSLDQVGPLAGDVAGAALLLEALAGHDPRDSTCLNVPVPTYSTTFDQPLEGLRIGVVPGHFAEGLADDVANSIHAALDVYRALGAEVRDVELPHSRFAVAAYYLIAPSEASSNLSRYDGIHYGRREENADELDDVYTQSRGRGLGDEVKRRIMLGTYALSAGYYDAYYLKALKVRRLIREDFDRAFNDVDVIAGPVAPTVAVPLGSYADDPLAMYLSDTYTISANLAGLPGISIPAGRGTAQMPIGLQLLGPPLSEERLLRAARMFERETDWHLKSAPRNGAAN